MLREFRGRRRRIISQGRGEAESVYDRQPTRMVPRPALGRALVCQVFIGYGLQPASGFGLVARTLPRKLVAPLVVLATPPASLEATRRMPGRSMGLGSVPSKTSLLDKAIPNKLYKKVLKEDLVTYKKSMNIFRDKKLIKFLCDVTTDDERSRMVPDPIAHSPLRPSSRRPRDQADARPKEKIRLIKVDQQTHTHTRTHAHTHPRTRNEEDNASSPAPGRLAFAIDLISLARSPGGPSCAPPSDRSVFPKENTDLGEFRGNTPIANA